MQDWMQAAANAAAEAAPVHSIAPAQVPGRVLHMDGDLLCYTCGGNEDTSVMTSRTNALQRIEKARVMSGSERVVLHLTTAASTKGDRRAIATIKPYQGQRNSSRRPKNWGYLREFFEGGHGQGWASKMWSTREADDGISYACWEKYRRTQELDSIHSGDKDMRMIPGVHLDWNTHEIVTLRPGDFEVYNQDKSKLFGTKWFWTQMLQGDTADNIPGLPEFNGKRVGEVTARKMLETASCNWHGMDIVSSAYALEYGCVEEWTDRFVEQAALLWMRTDAAASIGDMMKVFEFEEHDHQEGMQEAIDRLINRVEEKNAEAQKLGGLIVSDDPPW